MAKYKTTKEAARAWVRDYFSAVPQWLVEEHNSPEQWEYFGKLGEYEAEAWGAEYGSVYPPMWGTYFTPDDMLDEEWILDHMEEVAECGFTIIQNHENGFVALGVDGAGYSFYDAHWIPLYKARGLKWSDEDMEDEDE